MVPSRWSESLKRLSESPGMPYTRRTPARFNVSTIKSDTVNDTLHPSGRQNSWADSACAVLAVDASTVEREMLALPEGVSASSLRRRTHVLSLVLTPCRPPEGGGDRDIRKSCRD